MGFVGGISESGVRKQASKTTSITLGRRSNGDGLNKPPHPRLLFVVRGREFNDQQMVPTIFMPVP